MNHTDHHANATTAPTTGPRQYSRIQRLITSVLLLTFTNLFIVYPARAAGQIKEAEQKAGLLPAEKPESLPENAKRFFASLTPRRSSGPAPEDQASQLLNAIHEDLKALTPDTALSREALKAREIAQEQRAARLTHHESGRHSGTDKTLAAIGPNMHVEISHDQAEDNKPHTFPAGVNVNARVQNILSTTAELRKHYAAVRDRFAQTEQHLQDAHLPAIIMQRQQEALASFEARRDEFERLAQKVEQASANHADGLYTALADLGSFMAQYPNAKPHQYGDPTHLPTSTPSSKVRAPYLNKSQYQANLFPARYKLPMFAGPVPAGYRYQLAQASIPDAPNTADLATTEDVQITQPIRDLATQLNNNPVAIYNWVHNNIQFIPSYGSIQGSDMTLQNKRGNAFDTASLLIALLRAANVSSRYIYGTIELPADKVMNWVGGVTKPEAALSLLGQGGIPSIGVTGAGTITKIQMEHVWVEAYVSAFPSRGAITSAANPNATPHTWVVMDPSYKQYQFTQGMNIAQNVPVDTTTLLAQIQQGATVDTTQGYVQNLNQANAQTQLASYQTQIQNYVTSQKANATVGDVLGTQTIVAENHGILLDTLAYKTLSIGSTFQTLSDNLRWKFKTNIYPNDGISNSSSPLIEINQSTPSLAGKKITLSFTPATQADQDLINSYLPQPHADGTPIQPSELPSSLPGYLINVKAELRLDGQLVTQSTQSFTLGSTVMQANAYFNPASAGWEGAQDNPLVVGEYDAVGMDLQGVSATQLSAQQTKLQSTKMKLSQFQSNTNDPTVVAGLTRDDLFGDFLQTGILGYFSQVDSSDILAAHAITSIVTYRLPSYGRFFSSAQTHIFFGIVENVTFPSVVMDIGYLRNHAVAIDANASMARLFEKIAGSAGSSAEHEIPEMMLRNASLAANDPSQPHGISAIKALAIAATQKQKIYLLDGNNQALHDAILQSLQVDQDVKLEISDALATDRVVIIHEKDITFNGWTGSGYIVLDQDTGAGAYKISGGMNGGTVPSPTLTGLALGIIAGVSIIVLSSGILAAIVGAVGFIAGILLNQIYNNIQQTNFVAAKIVGIVAGIILAVILGGYVGITITPVFLFGFFIAMLSFIDLIIVNMLTFYRDRVNFNEIYV